MMLLKDNGSRAQGFSHQQMMLIGNMLPEMESIKLLGAVQTSTLGLLSNLLCCGGGHNYIAAISFLRLLLSPKSDTRCHCHMGFRSTKSITMEQ
jgi:hypothetical protein